MSSSVYFRFKSQKEPSRVVFDGTGISVFELKREIITMNKLGDGTDFELVVSSEDTNEVYDDDTIIIPRSTTVIAKRLPPIRPGRGGAARYVSGKMPQSAKNSHKLEGTAAKSALSTSVDGLTAVGGAQTEEQKLAAVFKMGADQWAQQQQEMAHAIPIHRSGPNKGKPANVPDHPPPPGYICYRCGEKGHWIQVCPTNDDPAYENRPRVKRTTGIPRSFLKTVEKPVALASDGTTDDAKQPPGIMVNAEGEWVIAEPDKAAWDQYQAKTKVSAAAQEAAQQGSKELQDRGLECSIDKHLFVDPTRTPCCQTSFCRDCITNALLENDLRCPECFAENVLIDDLVSDKDMMAKIRSYKAEKSGAYDRAENSKSPINEQEEDTKSSPAIGLLRSSSPSKDSSTNASSRKRSAEIQLVNDRIPSGPRGTATPTSSAMGNTAEFQRQIPTSGMEMLNPLLPNSNGNYMAAQGMNATVFPGMNNFLPMGLTVDPAMGMNPSFQNPFMMNGSFMGNDWNIWGGGYQQQPQHPQHPANMQRDGFQSNGRPNNVYSQQNNATNLNGMGVNGRDMSGQGGGPFANQQRTIFGTSSVNDEDSAYFRKPVNPHRHQARRNVQRPTDYREI